MARLLVFAPDALIRFRGGRIVIHTTASPAPAFVGEQPMMVGWLCQFAQPFDVDAALARLSPNDRAAIVPVLEHLTAAGTLVAAETVADGGDAAVALERSRQHLRYLARSAYELSADINAFGTVAETELSARTGIGVERRLLALATAVDGLRGELAALRDGYVGGQLARLGVAAGARDLNLHVGCGPGHLPGWINIDIAPAPLSLNVRWGLPFADGSVRFVFVSHLLEHLFFPVDAGEFVAEVARVLAPGGVVRIVVPDVAACIEAYRSNDAAFFASRRETWPWWPENPTRLEDFLAYAGAGPEPGWLFEAHKFGYDAETLSRLMTDHGLSAPTVSSYQGSAHPELRVDDISAVAKATYGDGRYYSLFMEATR